TVQTKDSGANNITAGGATVTLLTSLGMIGGVTDNNNGTYTATLTAGYTAGTATISGTINGSSIVNSGTVTLTANTFTGPGSFSDTSKWSANALPAASEDFVIKGSCTFDSGAPTRAYGSMTM